VQETVKVPQLERFVEDKYVMSMGRLWMLTTVIPQSYTHNQEEKKEKAKPSEKNPLLNSYHLIMKLVSTEPPPQLLPPQHNPLLNSYHLNMRLVSTNQQKEPPPQLLSSHEIGKYKPTKRTPPQLLPPQHNPLLNSYHLMRLVSTEPPPQLLPPHHETGEYRTPSSTPTTSS
jgi:hypothetical protein